MTPLPNSISLLYRIPAYLAALALSLLSIGVLIWTSPARAGAPRTDPQQKTEEYCLSCHNNPDLSMTLPSGEELSLYISPQTLIQSVHSPAGIECEACHTTITTYPHPKQTFSDRRSLSRSYYLACQKCHAANYEKTLDSMHNEIAEKGNLDAPICTDCHGAHEVRDPNQPRSLVSTTCGHCHQEIFSDYQKSIHGQALIEDNNLDVPVCTDCHGVHNVQDPRTEAFRIQTPEMCAGCHADPDLMSKYNLPSNVYSLYELSWHGVEVSVYKARWPTIWHDTAVCTDCHGIHDILDSTNPASSVHPDNLLATCQKCHPDAGPNWTGAWTGHEEIDQEKTPFLFYTQAFYTSFTPVVLWASIIYVILQILRATVDRVKRSIQ
jgi:predicted CXXCH cytochrome family protein